MSPHLSADRSSSGPAQPPAARESGSFERHAPEGTPGACSLDARSLDARSSAPADRSAAPSRAAAFVRTTLYLIGLLTVLAALGWAALLLGLPREWIGVMLLFGIGVTLIKGTRYTPHQR